MEGAFIKKMDMDHVAIIKLAYSNLYMEKISIKETLIQVISFYYDYYGITNDLRFKQLILDHVQAYLELGFPYEETSQFCDEILNDLLGKEKDIFIRLHSFHKKKVNLSKEQISNILGSWKKAKSNSGKKTEIIDDIYYKIKNHICGVYEYHTNLSGQGPIDRCTVLVISDEECYLKNPEGICYTFKIKP